MIRRVGKGDMIKFWKDHWVTEEPLLHQEGVLSSHDLECTLCGRWLVGH